MNEYVMLRHSERGEIQIVDNHTHIGKNKVCRLVGEGYVMVGTIESELPISSIKRGINYNTTKALDEQYEILRNVQAALNGDLRRQVDET